MSYIIKLREKVIEQRLKKETFVFKDQFGFMPKKSIIKVVYVIR